MKKIILLLLRQHFTDILENWIDKILQTYSKKLTERQARQFVESSLNNLEEVIESGDYTKADQYLIEIYNLFDKTGFNLLEISHLFSIGRFAMINFMENNDGYRYDPVILMGFLDEIIEQVYARYGLLHQQVQMRELENDRDRLATKLEHNQNYLENLLSSSDSAFMVIDKNENIIGWNKGAEKVFGYTKDEIIGQPADVFYPDSKKYSEEHKYIIEKIKTTGTVRVNETERLTKSGVTVSVNLNISKLPGNDEYTGRSVIIRDFTQVKKLQQQVDQSEKLAVIGKLAAGIAHEIGNPLASISSIVQILQRKTSEDFTRSNLANIKENIDRISRIVRELVDFSRPPGDQKMYTQITEVIKTAIGIVKYDKRVKKVDFKTELDPALPQLNVIPDQLLQVFVNIMLNALDAIKGEGIIKVTSYYDEQFVYVDIEDNGCGMDDNILKDIFDPFFTTKDVGKGTGLGLSVSYGIVKKFRGDILVKSIIDQGSVFTVKLPVKDNI